MNCIGCKSCIVFGIDQVFVGDKGLDLLDINVFNLLCHQHKQPCSPIIKCMFSLFFYYWAVK